MTAQRPGPPSLTTRLMFVSGAAFRTPEQCIETDRLPCPAFLTTDGFAGPVFDTLLTAANTSQAVRVTGTVTQETRDGLPVIMVTSATPVTPAEVVMGPSTMPRINPPPGSFSPGDRIRLSGFFNPNTRTFTTDESTPRNFTLYVAPGCLQMREELNRLAGLLEFAPFTLQQQLQVVGVARSSTSMCVDEILAPRRVRGMIVFQRGGPRCPCAVNPSGMDLTLETMQELVPALLDLARGAGVRPRTTGGPPGGQRPIPGERRPRTGPGARCGGLCGNEPRVTMEGFVVSTPDEMGIYLMRSRMGDFPLMPINTPAAQTLAMFAHCGRPMRMTGATQDGVMLADFVWPPGR